METKKSLKPIKYPFSSKRSNNLTYKLQMDTFDDRSHAEDERGEASEDDHRIK